MNTLGGGAVSSDGCVVDSTGISVSVDVRSSVSKGKGSGGDKHNAALGIISLEEGELKLQQRLVGRCTTIYNP